MALAASGCHQTVSEPYYLILDHAVKEYFLPDGDKEKALELLGNGCSGNEDSPDLLCYNAGILLLRENRPEEALDYFEEAASIKDIPLYRSAIESTRLLLDRSAVGFSEKAGQLIRGCASDDPEVLALLKQSLSSDQKSLQRFASQPAFEQCAQRLASGEELMGLQKTMQGIRSQLPDYAGRIRELDLQQHPLRGLWNPFWKYGQPAGDFPAVQAWADVLDSARNGSTARARESARRFFSLPQLAGSDQGVALRRSAALLILQDPFFDSVRSTELISLAQSNL
ncbi:MAG: hypothetical protein KDK25_03075 [Leptospiraceae bacterium]|nr:hypothetical protein [Leptospiraceae bacterium]